MEINEDGSIKGQTFSGEKFTLPYPRPKYNEETYGDYYNRVQKLVVEHKFHLGDLSWCDWGIYCRGFHGNDLGQQNFIINSLMD